MIMPDIGDDYTLMRASEVLMEGADVAIRKAGGRTTSKHARLTNEQGSHKNTDLEESGA